VSLNIHCQYSALGLILIFLPTAVFSFLRPTWRNNVSRVNRRRIRFWRQGTTCVVMLGTQYQYSKGIQFQNNYCKLITFLELGNCKRRVRTPEKQWSDFGHPFSFISIDKYPLTTPKPAGAALFQLSQVLLSRLWDRPGERPWDPGYHCLEAHSRETYRTEWNTYQQWLSE